MATKVGQTTQNYITYDLYAEGADKTAVVIGGNPNYWTGKLEIPDTVTYNNVTYNVVEIAQEAFMENKIIKTVVLKGVHLKSIGNSAFKKCTQLTTITFSDSIESIGDWAFHYTTKLTGTIQLPNNLTSLGVNVFYSSSITGVVINDKLTQIPSKAFGNCLNLKEINIGQSVESISDDAFYGATFGNAGFVTSPIENFIVNSNNAYFFAKDGVLYQDQSLYMFPAGKMVDNEENIFTIPDGINNISPYAFRQSIFNGTLDLNQVITLEHDAFVESKITKLIFAPFVSVFSKDSFNGCDSVENIVFKARGVDNELGTFPDSLFSGKKALCKVEFENTSITMIGNYMFSGCEKLKTVIIPNSLKIIGEGAFSYSGLTEIDIPKDCQLVTINSKAFYDCQDLQSIDITKNVTTIGSQAFYQCYELKTITIYSSKLNDFPIRHQIFYNIGRDIGDGVQLIIDSQVTKLPKNLFYYESAYPNNYKYFKLKKVTMSFNSFPIKKFGYLFGHTDGNWWDNIPPSIEEVEVIFGTIPNSAFSNCGKIQLIILNKDVTFEYSAFDGCEMLTEIQAPEDHVEYTTIEGNIYNKDQTILIRYAPGKLESSVNINGVSEIRLGAFSSANNISELSLPFVGDGSSNSNAAHFGYIFGASSYTYNKDCVPSTLTNIILTKATSIEDNAFNGCGTITSIIVNDGVSKIGQNAFKDCKSLSSITFETDNQILVIDNDAFSGCSSIVSTYINTIKDWCNIVFVNQNSNPLYCGGDLFIGSEKKQLTELNTRDLSITEIKSYAFYNYIPLEKVSLLNIATVGEKAFYNCKNLETINDTMSLTTIGKNAFEGCLKITKIFLPKATAIEESVLKGCNAIGEITIPVWWSSDNADTLDFVGYLFDNSADKTNSNIPSALNKFTLCGTSTISKLLFSDCSNIETIILNNVEFIEENAFSGCNRLKNLEITTPSLNYYTVDNIIFLKEGDNHAIIKYAAGKHETEYVVPLIIQRIAAGAFKDSQIKLVNFQDNTNMNISKTAFQDVPSVNFVYNFNRDDNQSTLTNYPYGAIGNYRQTFLLQASDEDFMAFSFNGYHSKYDLNIIRTSDGGTYNDPLTPTLQDKTAEITGGDGVYYFGTHYRQKNFNINIAFDSLTETELRKIKKVFNGKELGDLIFDEYPYKVYSAKITGQPSLKALCFTQDGQRVYKGTGTIQFTAYWPFAHTPDANTKISTRISPSGKFGQDGRNLNNYAATLYATKNEWSPDSGLINEPSYIGKGENYGDIPAPFVCNLGNVAIDQVCKVGDLQVTIKEAATNTKWNSKTGIISGIVTENEVTKERPLAYTGNALGAIPVGNGLTVEPATATLEYYYWYY